MIKVCIPNNYLPERKYAVTSLFRDLPASAYSFETHSEPDYSIVLPDNKKITIKDAFFGLHAENESYISESNIPENIAYMTNEYTHEPDMPVLFGGTELKQTNKALICEADIFASAFFMLTRWEEAVIKDKDKHERIVEEKQLSVKHNFFFRPIVDEYVRFINNILRTYGLDIAEKPDYELVITHDVDSLRRYDKLPKFIRALGGDLLLRKSLKLFFGTIKDYFLIKAGKRKDPYDVFDFFMNISEKHKLKSHFYFIPGYKGEPDVRYNINDSEVIQLIGKLKKRKHIIGLHGSYRAYNNKNYFRTELNRLKKIVGADITEGRQHFLRFSNPETWRLWEQNSLKIDSTLGFYSRVGFRAGTANEYPVFDILNRETLSLRESPLIAMEVALKRMQPDYKTGLQNLKALKEKIHEYGGKFILLWHNDKLNAHEWKDYSVNYEAVISTLNNN